MDFERREDDELGFRKNDLITIISQKDDHCWIGELNGKKKCQKICGKKITFFHTKNPSFEETMHCEHFWFFTFSECFVVFDYFSKWRVPNVLHNSEKIVKY